MRRATKNDPSFTTLRLVGTRWMYDHDFYSENSADYSTVGAAIANNTHLERLVVLLSNRLPRLADRGFFNGLKANSSISDLRLYCEYTPQNIAGGVAHEILKVYQENNSHLTYLYISNANLQNRGDRVIVDTLRNCRNLQIVDLTRCSITDEQLLPIVDAVRGLQQLKELTLGGSVDNNIGYAGCEAIATLLTDPNCNLQTLDLGGNNINNEGANTIANSLINNTKLWELCLYYNQIDRTFVEDVFSNVLCNTSNINHTYSSNHTLETLNLNEDRENGPHLASLLSMNSDSNKSHVAIRKILKYHPNIDMEPLFDWDAEGEQTLKALPYIIDWFEGAREAIAIDDEEYNIEGRKLSAIFQLAKAMPLLLEGISHINAVNEKRKRED